MSDWVEREMAGCRLHDARAQQRLGVLLKRLAERSTQSIPAACHGGAETPAAYRFLHNPRISPRAILQGHVQATLERLRSEPVVRGVQDTTFLEQARDGAGPAARAPCAGARARSTCCTRVSPSRPRG